MVTKLQGNRAFAAFQKHLKGLQWCLYGPPVAQRPSSAPGAAARSLITRPLRPSRPAPRRASSAAGGRGYGLHPGTGRDPPPFQTGRPSFSRMGARSKICATGTSPRPTGARCCSFLLPTPRPAPQLCNWCCHPVPDQLPASAFGPGARQSLESDEIACRGSPVVATKNEGPRQLRLSP